VTVTHDHDSVLSAFRARPQLFIVATHRSYFFVAALSAPTDMMDFKGPTTIGRNRAELPLMATIVSGILQREDSRQPELAVPEQMRTSQ
jgi:hypothetical protein